MFAPGARHHSHVPHSLTPLLLAILAVVGVIVGWAALAARPASDERYDAPPVAAVQDLRSMALLVPGGSYDVISVRPIAGGPSRVVATLPAAFNLHARGAASPLGDRLALVHVGATPGRLAQLSIVALPSGAALDAGAGVDYQSALAWSPDGERLAAVRTDVAADGTATAVIVEVQPATGVSAELGHFDNVLEAAPVGYTADSAGLYVVVIDQSGSSLWLHHDGRFERIATLSPGPTRDWALSPDGSRLAFVDRLGAGGRSYAGRMFVIASGTLTTAAEDGDQLGAVWRPGWDLPDFGGPAGNLQLTGVPQPASYVFPLRWTPDGSALVAAIYSASRGPLGEPSESIELVSPGRRVPLSSEPGTRFLGWVRDVD